MFELMKNAYSRYLGRRMLFLIQLEHSQFSQTWRFVNNNKALTLDGYEWQALPFKIVLNTQGETSGTSISIANIDVQITEEIKKAISNEDIICKIWLVHYEELSNNVVYETEYKGSFIATSPEITEEQINLNLNLRLSLDFNIGTIRYTKNRFPNLFL